MLSSTFNGYPVHLVESVGEIDKIKEFFDPKIDTGLDTETSGLNYVTDTIAGVCISGGKSYTPAGYHGFYLPVDHIGYARNLPKDKVIELTQWLVDKFKVCLWNRDYDNTMLEKEGYNPPCPGNTHDIQCMAHLVKGDSFPALKDFAETYLKFDVLHYSDNNAEAGSFKSTDPTVSYIYAAGDPILTVLLGRKLWAEYQYIHKIYPLDNRFAEVMRRIMRDTELYLDKDIVNKLLEQNIQEQAIVKKQIFNMAGYQFRLSSNADIADCLSRYVTLTKKTKSGKLDTSKEVLSEIDHPMAQMIIKAKNLDKFRSTYLQKMANFPQPFRINYQHCNVSTGRLSSGSSKGNDYFAPFNIQNVPKKEVIKYLHWAPVSSVIKWYLISSDVKPIGANTIVITPTGKVCVKDLHPGDKVLTPKGEVSVIECVPYNGPLTLVSCAGASICEGTYIRPDGKEWFRTQSTIQTTDIPYSLVLEDSYSVCVPHGTIQIKTLQSMKTKAAMREAFICPPSDDPNDPYVWVSADYCVTGDTLVTTKEGMVAISELQDGTLVCTPDGFKRCYNVHQTGLKEEWIVTTDLGEVNCSSDHPFWTPKGWINAEDLTVGTFILGVTSVGIVTDIKKSGHYKIMWDMTVESAHCFYANGVLVHNCSQEMVVLANFSKEPVLIEPLLKGEDIHKFVATKMFGHYEKTMRTQAKAINFASNYGGTGFTIAKRLGITPKEGEALLDKYNKTLSHAYAWKQAMCKEGRRRGYICTYFGRPRVVSQWYQSSDRSKWGFADRTCMNSPIQGTGGDLIRMDYCKLYKRMMTDPEWNANVKHLLTVHDEINVASKASYMQKAFEGLRQIMEVQYDNWAVPLKVSPSIGFTWGDQIELIGFTEDGTPIPDADPEDLSMLG